MLLRTLLSSSCAAVLALFVGTGPARAACHHPSQPTAVGTRWVWQTEDGEKTRVRVVAAGESSFELEAIPPPTPGADPAPIRMTGACDEHGLRLEGLGFGRSVSQEGVYLGPPGGLEPGATWSERRTLDIGEAGAPVRTLMETVTTYRVVGPAKVTVPAGSYDTLEVSSEAVVTTRFQGAGAESLPSPPPITVRTTQWLAKGVGMVKTVTTAPGPGGEPQESTRVLVEFGS
jgi:hypothetical protein